MQSDVKPDFSPAPFSIRPSVTMLKVMNRDSYNGYNFSQMMNISAEI